MKRNWIAAACILAVATAAYADQIDEAEAAKRGVPVAVVELESAKIRIAALTKQIADLQSQITDQKAQIVKLKAPKPAVATPTTSAASQPAMPAHEPGALAVGMTLEQCDKALGLGPIRTHTAKGVEEVPPHVHTGTIDGAETYTWTIYEKPQPIPAMIPGAKNNGGIYRAYQPQPARVAQTVEATFKEGKLTNWNSH